MKKFFGRQTVDLDASASMLWKLLTSQAKTQAQSKSAHCRLSMGGFTPTIEIIVMGICLLLAFGSATCAQAVSQVSNSN
jgi:hypothetical protein